MNKTNRNLLALLIANVPAFSLLVWYRLTHEEAFTISDMLIYPLLVGGGLSLLILWLNKVLLKSTFKKTFNPARESVSSDLVMAVMLTLLFFFLYWVEKITVYKWFPQNNVASAELIELIQKIAYNPALMALWMGPVVWIGVAVFEELSRAFFLKCMWNISQNKFWQILVVIISTLMTMAVHLHQGIAGMISVGVMGLLLALYFYQFKRILPLILAHGFYDAIQLFVLVYQYR
ncbi:MAG: CPBP family intramembrane metalloprotease [Candidatus Marinimicrobia bacterium]|nr:CPBP family intramembrane metalloprotease [Candidatus Neomarinimicrobiota bacterium]